MKISTNLNELAVRSDWERPDRPLVDHSAVSSDGKSAVHFRELERRLVEQIEASTVVVGCVAWLTSEAVLTALATARDGVSMVVQKEDFLRPDWSAPADWKGRLRRLYEDLPQLPERHQFAGLVGSLSTCCEPVIDSVRCVGNHNREKKPAFPRMHNKFLVFGDLEWMDDTGGRSEYLRPRIVPRAVWTGSFNLTKNATLSLENAVVLSDRTIVRAYLQEWEQILAISEPLDWEADWCEPEWRVGT